MANTFSWNTSNGVWSVASNWTDLTSGTSGPPTTADEADFAGTGGTVTGSGNAAELSVFGSGAWTLTAGSIALADILTVGGNLVVDDTLTTPFLNQTSGSSNLDVPSGGHLTVTGTLTSAANGFLNGVNIANTATVDGGVFDSTGGEINIGTANQGAVVVVQNGGTVDAWATVLGSTPGQPASVLLSGAGATWSDLGGVVPGSSNTGGYFIVGGGYPNGVGTNATLTVTGGALLTDAGAGLIATQSGGTGVVNVSAGGIWHIGGGLSVGSGGTGTLTVSTAGTVLAAGPFNSVGNSTSQGTVTVTDAGSLLSFGGSVSDTNGTISVLNGGAVVTSGTIVNSGTTHAATDSIGGNTGANGLVLVDAAHWTSGGALTVGAGSGAGTLTVRNAGTLSTLGTLGDVFNAVGNNPGSQGTVTVTGSGSLLHINGDIDDGNSGSGVISVLSGGSVFSSSLANSGGTISLGSDTIGGNAGGSGTLLVDAATWTSAGGFTIGNFGIGSVTIQNAGLLSVGTELLLGGFPGAGGSSTGIGALTVQSGGSIVSNGSFDSVGGGLGSSGTVTINGAGSGWTSSQNLIIGGQGTGRVTVQNNGRLTLGDGLTIGGYNGPGGTLASTGDGSLAVLSGGTVAIQGGNDSRFQNIGGGVNTVGSLTVSGTASLLSAVGVLQIGASGFATASVLNGGSVTTTGLWVNSGTTQVVADTVGAGPGSYGSLAVNGGTWTAGGGFNIGGQAGAMGEVSLNNGTISSASNALIGSSGAGAMTIGAGGTFVSNGTFNAVGNAAGSDGSLLITSGGTWVSSLAPQTNSIVLSIGNSAAGTLLPAAIGTVRAVGTGALINTNGNPLSVGNSGIGSLLVSQGASVVAGSANSSTFYSVGLGNRGGTGQLTVSDAHSTVTANGYFLDGRGGTGSVLVENSASLIINDSPLNGSGMGIGAGGGSGPSGSPSNVGGSGSAVVTSGGLLAVNSTSTGITVGGNGVNGELAVNNGGTVLAGTGMTIGTATSASGTIYGGTGELDIGAGGVVRVQNPTLTGYDITIGNANASIGGTTSGTATGAASGQAVVSGAGALLDANGAGIAVGWLSPGVLTVSQGASVVAGSPDDSLFNPLAIGRRASGSVTITDKGSTFTANGSVYVGRAGTGSLLVENQGTLADGLDGKGQGGISIGGVGIGTSGTLTYIATGGSGSGLVTGGGVMTTPQGLSVGTNGTNGDLTINAGGTVAAGTTVVIGDSVFVPSGDAIITPSGSFTSAGTLIGTSGVLNVGPGGTLTAGGTGVAAGMPVLTIGAGAEANGALNVSGSNASVTDAGLLVVGSAGVGALTIQGGATVSAQGADVGAAAGGDGIVNISDAGSALDINGALNIGTAGVGALVMGVGTTLDVTGTVHIGTLGALDQFGGTIDPTDFTNDGVVVGGGGASIDVTGTLTNDGTYSATDGALSLNVGTIAGGGTLAIGPDGELQLSGSVGSGQTISFSTSGSATGALIVTDLDSFTPGVIDNFSSTDAIVIASTSTLTQSFSNGTLTLTNDTGTSVALDFGGTHTVSDFVDTVQTAVENTGSISGPSPLTGNYINDGTIGAAGSLEVAGRISGSGTLAVAAGGLLQLDTIIGNGQTVDFAGATGTLVIGDIGDFSAVIDSFHVGNTIVLPGATIASDSFDPTRHALTLFDGGHGTIGVIDFGPGVTGVAFAAAGSVVAGSAPVLTGAGNTLSFKGGESAVAINPGLTIADAASTTLVSATVVVAGGFSGDDDVLSANTIGTAITLSYNAGSETLTLSGTDTLADYQAVLDSTTFVSGAPDPTNGGANSHRTVSWQVNDGLATSNAVASTIDVMPCFAAGTHIDTPRGAMAVEALRVGDLVCVADGGVQPVVWTGQRRVDCKRHNAPPLVWPVRIAADAFGAGLPVRDLLLSPDHALFIDGVLIPVKHLIDGKAIAQMPVASVTYYHVELPRHDVLIAEGLPSESYLDIGDRRAFANGGGPVALHPDFASRAWEAEGCAPLVVTGAKIEGVRRRIAGGIVSRAA
jgi:T5SS/PEP-CTERM-associated repeat protein